MLVLLLPPALKTSGGEGGEEALYWCSGLACLALARSKQLSGLDAEWS